MKSHPYWITMGIETSIPWPQVEITINFEGIDFILRPESDDKSPSIVFEIGSLRMTYEEGMKIFRRFLSVFSWNEGGGIKETFGIAAAFPGVIGKGPKCGIQSTQKYFEPLSLPESDKAKLALALYREALNTNSKPYKFLSFFKILNIFVKTRTEHMAWINTNLSKLCGADSIKVINELKEKGVDVGDHIYTSGRCAIAHANVDPILDPDSSEDLKRISNEISLVQELAEIAIEFELGVRSRDTIYKEHKYELEGFREVLDAGLVREVEAGGARIVDPKEVNLELQFWVLTYLKDEKLKFYIDSGEMKDGVLYLGLRSLDQTISLWIGLAFLKERLIGDPYDGFVIIDNGSFDCLETIKRFYGFLINLFKNGCLQIEDAKNGKLLGRKTAFIPCNIDLGGTIRNFEKVIQDIEQEKINRKPS